MDWLITFCTACLVLGLIWVFSATRLNNSPPGPFPLPVVGNLVYIARQDPVNFIALHKVSKKYGDITSLKIGRNQIVLISSIECAKDLYSRADCLNRPVNDTLKDRILNQNIGLVFSNGEGWNNIRKFSSCSLRSYGFGNRNDMERLIKDELVNLIEFINDKLNQSDAGVMYFDNFFQTSFLNLMSSMVTGKRHSYEDKELQGLAQASEEWFDTPALGFLVTQSFPVTRFLCPGLLGYTKQMNAMKKMLQYARNLLDKKRTTVNYEEERCFTDSFLKMARENRNDPASMFSDDQFAVLCVDLLQGGADTTSNWLAFALLLLLLHPESQKKVVDEISQVIGFDRAPELHDQEKMIYTKAVIYEVHRFARLTVVLPPRASTEDFKYRNYYIKKGTTILVNLHSCFMDPDVWGDPETFRPSRFLDAHNQLINVDKMSISFGAGRRVCFGESLAKASSFLYLTTILQTFSFEMPPSSYSIPVFDPIPGIILRPKPYYALVRPRN